ncbi:MAG: hypothetical protein GYB64_19875, partial [Chloroflexi bacterium]|nr:hypothetical protein [Chloroflexota bacterium]
MDSDQIPLRELNSARRSDPLAAVLLMIGAALRVPLLQAGRFHPDEALFATLARLIVQGIDPWLVETSLLVDKPPLFFYALAAGVSLEWGSELTARLPGFFAGMVSIALTMRIAMHLWPDRRAAHGAGVVMALSPFTVLFSPTAFADPLMIMWWLAALAAATGSSPQWLLAGLLMGASLATKLNALVLLPLLLVVGLLVPGGNGPLPRHLLGFAAGLCLAAALVALWDLARPGVSFWAANLANNDPGRLIRSGEILPRLLGWAGYARLIVGAVPLAAILTGGLVAVSITQPDDAVVWGLVASMLGYGALLWLVAFPILDRYVLPLVPLCALLCGWASTRIRVAPVVLTALMVPGALTAAQGGYPIGADRGAFDGIVEVTACLSTEPPGTVVYHQALG